MKKFLQKFAKFMIPSLVVFSLFFSETFAQGFAGITTDTSAFDETLKGFGQIASLVIQVLTFVSLLLLSLIGDLIGTEFIAGDEAMDVLRPMWILIRNLANIGFVLVIVYLAFANLIASFSSDGGGGNWTIKSKLPKIILALIAINFSLLFFRVILDAINLGTVAIFSLADSQLESQTANSSFHILNSPKWTLSYKPKPSVLSSSQYTEVMTGDLKENQELLQSGTDCSGTYNGLGYNQESTTERPSLYWGGDFQGQKEDEDGNISTMLVCGSFIENINNMFCAEGRDDDKCFFRIKKDSLYENSFLSSDDNTAQNLFMAFGTSFMRLERLPALAAGVGNIFQVLDNTLFSAILAIAYGVALLALFIVLVVRVLALWLTLVASPLIIAGSILGIQAVSQIREQIITFLVIPLKMALVFSVSFVMMSGLIEFRPNGKEGIFEFGAALGNLAIDEYAIMWQIATIVVFWQAAKWALKDVPFVGEMVNGIFAGAEKAGKYLASSATTEAQVFKTAQGTEFGVQTLLEAPMKKLETAAANRAEKRRKALTEWRASGFATGDNDFVDSLTKITSTDYHNGDRNKLKEGIDKITELADDFSTLSINKSLVLGKFKQMKYDENNLTKSRFKELEKDFTQSNLIDMYKVVGGNEIKYKSKADEVETTKGESYKKTTGNEINKNESNVISFGKVDNVMESNKAKQEIAASVGSTFKFEHKNENDHVVVELKEGDYGEDGKMTQEAFKRLMKANKLELITDDSGKINRFKDSDKNNYGDLNDRDKHTIKTISAIGNPNSSVGASQTLAWEGSYFANDFKTAFTPNK